jgi:hypothetical protein
VTSRGEGTSIEFASQAGNTERIRSRRGSRKVAASDKVVLDHLVDMSQRVMAKSPMPEFRGERQSGSRKGRGRR